MEYTTKHIINIGSLDLGNNYTMEHLFTELGKHEEANELLDFLGICEPTEEVTLVANLNFNGLLQETFIVDEVYDMLDAKIDNDEEEENNTCDWCGDYLENNKMFCSKECLEKDLNS